MSSPHILVRLRRPAPRLDLRVAGEASIGITARTVVLYATRAVEFVAVVMVHGGW